LKDGEPTSVEEFLALEDSLLRRLLRHTGSGSRSAKHPHPKHHRRRRNRRMRLPSPRWSGFPVRKARRIRVARSELRRLRWRLVDELYQPPKSQRKVRKWLRKMKMYGPSDKRLKKGQDIRKRKPWIEFERGTLIDSTRFVTVVDSKSISSTRKVKVTDGITSLPEQGFPLSFML